MNQQMIDGGAQGGGHDGGITHGIRWNIALEEGKEEDSCCCLLLVLSLNDCSIIWHYDKTPTEKKKSRTKQASFLPCITTSNHTVQPNLSCLLPPTNQLRSS
jgi:hypothetical protein